MEFNVAFYEFPILLEIKVTELITKYHTFTHRFDETDAENRFFDIKIKPDLVDN